MSCQRLAGTGILVVVAVVTWLTPMTAAGQSQPLTAWGEPDLQGVWDFRTVTPMERPEELAGQEFLTAEEAAGLEQRAVERQVDRPPREGDPGTYNQFWMDSGTNIVGTRRTSLITDPPDGRIPDLAPQAKRRQDELAEARTGVGDDVPRPGGWVEDVPVSVRCIVGFNSGPPMYPAAYNNNMQVFQAPGYVALFNEMGPGQSGSFRSMAVLIYRQASDRGSATRVVVGRVTRWLWRRPTSFARPRLGAMQEVWVGWVDRVRTSSWSSALRGSMRTRSSMKQRLRMRRRGSDRGPTPFPCGRATMPSTSTPATRVTTASRTSSQARCERQRRPVGSSHISLSRHTSPPCPPSAVCGTRLGPYPHHY